MPYKDPDERREYRKRHYATHKELYKSKAAIWKKANPEQAQLSNAASARRAYAKMSPEQRTAYYWKHRQAIQARQKAQYSPAKERARTLRKNYQMSVEDYDRMYALQAGKCAICLVEAPAHGTYGLAVDHCHNTGKVRGLLCRSCNTALGQLKDSLQTVERMANYIRSR